MPRTMNCRACGQENREGAAFCGHCGASLAEPVGCPACGTENPRGRNFCDSCGQPLAIADAPEPRSYTPPHLAEKILRDRSEMEGERRTVTVLFADAVGSTPMAERVGEEAMYGLMQGCLARMVDAVHKHEGTVTHFLGDGVMALFGAPIANEDSARRAAEAALEMQRSLGEYAAQSPVECAFRVGLNTGPVIVGRISDNLEMDYTAIGDTANLAARVQQSAEPGSVFLSEHTWRAVRDYVRCEPLGPIAVKGKDAPVLAYRALGAHPVRTRFEAATLRGLTPLVGRQQELEVLGGYLGQATQGRGQAIFLSGEAGIGKSRLLLEFRRSLGERVGWLEGHCVSYGSKIPYVPIIELVKGVFGVEEGDDAAAIEQRIDEGVAGWDLRASRAAVPYLKSLLSVDPGDGVIEGMDPRERRAGVFDALRTLLAEESRRRPLVVVVEDLHWVDQPSEETLAVVAEAVASAPMLLILTARPGYTHTLGDRSYVSRLAVGHLPPEGSAALAARVLEVDALPADLARMITAKAEGNPFYVEEVTKSLVESGALRRRNGGFAVSGRIEEVSIPDTIQEVILSRIDRLERKAREAIQLASVIGREFTVRLLDRISDVEAQLDDVLGQLKGLELIYEKAYFPELSYMFKHALTHDVAYSTLLASRRQALHRLIAAAIEELYADRLAEHYETLAHHYDEGGDAAKALDYLGKAADKAAATDANQEALDFYERAIAIAEGQNDNPSLVSLRERAGVVRLGLGDVDGAMLDFGAMLGAARRAADRGAEGLALCHRGMAELLAHRFEASERSLREALALADEGHDDVRAFGAMALMFLCMIVGRPDETPPLRETVESLRGKVDDPYVFGMFGCCASITRNWEGDYDEALREVDRWLPEAERSVPALPILELRWVEGLAFAGKGAYEEALTTWKDVLAHSERVGDVFMRMRLLNSIGWVHYELGDHDEAVGWNRASIEVGAAAGLPDPEIESNARLNLADIFLAQGRFEEVAEELRLVEAIVRSPRPEDRWMQWRFSQHYFHAYGALCVARGDLDAAEASVREGLALAEDTGSRRHVIKLRRLLGQVLMARGQVADGERELRTALELAALLGNPYQLERCREALSPFSA